MTLKAVINLVAKTTVLALSRIEQATSSSFPLTSLTGVSFILLIKYEGIIASLLKC